MKIYTRVSMFIVLLQICSIHHIFAQSSLSITPDSTFGTNGTKVLVAPPGDFEYLNDMAIQPDGKIVVAGYTGSNGSTPSVARYFINGDLDTTFGSGGYTYLHSYWDRGTCAISVIKLLANGKMIVSGRHDSVSLTGYLARLNANGKLDSTFGTNGYTYFGAAYSAPQMLVLSDGTIIYGYLSNNGSPGIYKLVKTDSSGVVDPLFGGGAGFVTINELGSVNSLILCQNDRMLAAGTLTAGGLGFVRFLPNGNHDNTYGINGVASFSYTSTNPYFGLGSPIAILQADNSIVVGLTGGFYQPIYAIHILSNGNADMNYGLNGLDNTGSYSFSYSYPTSGIATFNQETLLTGFSTYTSTNYGELLAETSGGQSDTIIGSVPNGIVPASVKIFNGNKMLVGGTFGFNVSVTKYNISSSPLVIQSFSAQKQPDSTSLLNWSTATEQNYDHFVIMRSIYGYTNWDTIGTVAAVGNSNVQTNYSYRDSFPKDGDNYYKLKLVGTNGKYVYSSSVLLVHFTFPAPTCPVPVPYVYELTSTTAKLKFNSGGGTALYYQYAIAPDPNNWTYAEPPLGTLLFNSTDTTINLTGLSETTRYFLWMRAKCTNNVATAWSASKFTTLCNSTTIPYFENFSTANFPCIQAGPWYLDPNTINGLPIGLSLSQSFSGPLSGWFFTKRFQLNAGTTYRVYFKYMSNNLGQTTQTTSIKVQMANYPDSNSLTGPVLVTAPFIGSQLYYAKDSFGLFTPATSGLYCAGIYSYSNYATGKVTIPEVDVIVDPGIPACPQNLLPVNNAVLSNCNNFLFKWNKINGATSYNVYLSDSILAISNSLLNFFAVSDTFYNFDLCAYPGDRFSWYVVPRAYGSNATGCPLDSSVFRMENPPAPANDLCANAQTLAVTNGFCSSPVKGTLLNATISNSSDSAGICKRPYFGPPGSQAPPLTGNDIWYKLVVPVTGNLLVQISPFSSNAYANTVMRAFSGACGALTPIACSYVGLEVLPFNPYPPYSDRLKLTGRTPGETIFIRVSASSPSAESYFTICSYDTTTSQLPDIVTTPNVCTPIVPLVIDSLSGNQFMWVPLLTADGRIIGEVHGKGSSFGTLTGAVYVNNGPVRSNGGIKYFDRNMTLTPSLFTLPDLYTQPFIRLYIKNSEVAAFDAAAGSSSLLNFKVLENHDPCTNVLTNPGTALGNIADTGVYKGDRRISFLTGGFSSFYLYKGANQPLPLHLLYFTGQKCNSGNVCLYWQTANELNADRFEIERSVDGTTFNITGSVLAKNRALNDYSSTDDISSLNAGTTIVYYRLKQFDIDGRFTYSNVVKINLDRKYSVSIFPNPAHDYLTIIGAEKFRQIQLITVTGKIVMDWQPMQQNTFDVSKVAKGMYMVRLIAVDGVQTEKIIIE